MGVDLQEETETDMWMDGRLVREERRPDGKKHVQESKQQKSFCLDLVINTDAQMNGLALKHTYIHTLVTFNRGNTLVIISQQDVLSGWIVYEL